MKAQARLALFYGSRWQHGSRNIGCQALTAYTEHLRRMMEP
jgi:hypothetical protein